MSEQIDYQCGRCGSSIEWRECWQCGGDGYVDVDSIEGWDEGDQEMCDICSGKGAWPVCISSQEWCEANPMPGREHTPRSTPESFTIPTRKRIRAVALLALAVACVHVRAQNVLTKSYDSSRTSENRSETVLTPAKVAAGMAMLPRIPVIGDARGMEAQVLIDGTVMVLPSMANVIRGVTVANGTAIWQTKPLCAPVMSGPAIDMWGINQYFGMMSTGVIDGDTHKLYQVATCSKDGSGNPSSLVQRLFVLDDRTGVVLASAAVQGSDQGMSYGDAPRKQRAALLLWRGVGASAGVKFVMVLAGSFSENGAQATGWLLAFDTFDNTFKAALSTKAGGWMSGEGPAEDMATGLMYLGLGNGPFDGVHQFGESALQVAFTPSTATTAAAFTVQHAWAPFSDNARTCVAVYPAVKVAGVSAPTGVPGAAMPMAADAGCNAAWGDQDAHLTGTLIPDRNLYVTAGKDGITYLLPTQAFPDTKPADFANPKANCAKVTMVEAGWNLGMDPCPMNAPALNRLINGQTKHQHAPIVQYHAPSGRLYLGFCAENSPLQFWRLNADGSMTYVARGAEMASAGVASGMPGCFSSVSSNAGANAIAWSSFPVGNANRSVTTGFLVAYDLTHLEDATPTLPTIWRSAPYVFSKFSQPIVSGGQVYLPDYAGSMMVWKVGQ